MIKVQSVSTAQQHLPFMVMGACSITQENLPWFLCINTFHKASISIRITSDSSWDCICVIKISEWFNLCTIKWHVRALSPTWQAAVYSQNIASKACMNNLFIFLILLQPEEHLGLTALKSQLPTLSVWPSSFVPSMKFQCFYFPV